MASALFWYPRGSPKLKKITLAQEFSEITEDEEVDAVESESISGRLSRIVYSTRKLVQVESELITDQDDALELDALVSHLRQGGTCMVAEDQTKTLGAFARIAPERDASLLFLYDNIFEPAGDPWDPDAGEILRLRGPSPRGMEEHVVCTGSGSGATPALELGPRNDWGAERWCWVTNRRFWPFLKIQRGRHSDPLLRSSRRIHYTLDLPLEESPWALERIAISPQTPIVGTTEEQGTGSLPWMEVFRGERGYQPNGPGSSPDTSITGKGWY